MGNHYSAVARTTAKIRKLQAEYEACFDNLLVGIACLNNTTITRCNTRCEEIFGYSPGELEGVSARALFSSDSDYRRIGKAALAAFKQQRDIKDEVLMQRKSGDHFWCALNGTNIDPTVATETLWFFQDTSERRQAEQVLARMQQEVEFRVAQRTASLTAANRTLQAEMQRRRRNEDKQREQQTELARMARINTAGEMVSSLAHELGQPLASMLNYTQGCLLRLASGNATHEELKHGLVQAARNAEQAGEIVRRVRRFLHKRSPERRLQDINKVLREIITFLDAEAHLHEIALRVRCADQPLNCLMDRIEIEQVVVNLVKNAFDAMTDTVRGSKIVEISCLKGPEDTIVMAVADNGPGVPESLKDSIFEPYFSTKNKGMGFGLAICCSLIEKHGGKIRLGESWLGGALFEVLLPSGETGVEETLNTEKDSFRGNQR